MPCLFLSKDINNTSSTEFQKCRGILSAKRIGDKSSKEVPKCEFGGIFLLIANSFFFYISQDYIVFLPEDYFNAEVLQEITGEPCLLRTSKPEYCDMYTYFDPKGPSLVTLSGDKAHTLPLKGRPDMFSDPRFDLSNSRFSNMALLGGNQVSLAQLVASPCSANPIKDACYIHVFCWSVF